MPCIFFEDLPKDFVADPNAAVRLYLDVASAAGVSADNVEIHLGYKRYQILNADGSTHPAPDVHIFVEWNERPFRAKERVAAAIHEFCVAHGLQSDLAFRDSGPGTFFVNGKLIGEPPAED